MQEKYRLEMIKHINDEKARIATIKAKTSRFQELENNPLVREYFKLKEELLSIKDTNEASIIESSISKVSVELDNEVYIFVNFAFYSDDFSTPMYDLGMPEIALKANYSEFYSLDKKSWISIPVGQYMDFIYSHKVINSQPLLKQFGSSLNIEAIRLYYFELLFRHSAEEAFNILKETYGNVAKSKNR